MQFECKYTKKSENNHYNSSLISSESLSSIYPFNSFQSFQLTKENSFFFSSISNNYDNSDKISIIDINHIKESSCEESIIDSPISTPHKKKRGYPGYSKELKIKIMSDYLSGLYSLKEICKMYKVDRKTIYLWRRYGFEGKDEVVCLRKKLKRKMPQNEESRRNILKEYFERKLSIKELLKKYNISKSCIVHWIRHGIQDSEKIKEQKNFEIRLLGWYYQQNSDEITKEEFTNAALYFNPNKKFKASPKWVHSFALKYNIKFKSMRHGTLIDFLEV